MRGWENQLGAGRGRLSGFRRGELTVFTPFHPSSNTSRDPRRHSMSFLPRLLLLGFLFLLSGYSQPEPPHASPLCRPRPTFVGPQHRSVRTHTNSRAVSAGTASHTTTTARGPKDTTAADGSEARLSFRTVRRESVAGGGGERKPRQR